jgi:hypothetical protein
MLPFFLAAAIAGQLPTPQSLQAAPPAPAMAPAVPVTAVLLAAPAPAPQAVAPSILISRQPFWDRAALQVAHWLEARNARHQHVQPAALVTVAPVAVQAAPLAPQPVQLKTLPLPTPSAQSAAASEAAPPPPAMMPAASSPLLYVAPADGPVQRLFRH